MALLVGMRGFQAMTLVNLGFGTSVETYRIVDDLPTFIPYFLRKRITGYLCPSVVILSLVQVNLLLIRAIIKKEIKITDLGSKILLVRNDALSFPILALEFERESRSIRVYKRRILGDLIAPKEYVIPSSLWIGILVTFCIGNLTLTTTRPFLTHQTIPKNVLAIIFSYLSAEDIFACQRVCKFWDQLLKDSSFREKVGFPKICQRLAFAQTLLNKMPRSRLKFFTHFTKKFSLDIVKNNKIELIVGLGGLYLANRWLSNIESSMKELDELSTTQIQQLMKNYNDQEVRESSYDWEGGGSSDNTRLRTESEKFFKEEEYIKFHKDGLIVGSRIISLGRQLLSTMSVLLILLKLRPLWYQSLNNAKIESLRDLSIPLEHAKDIILRHFVDDSGHVMLLPVQHRNGRCYDYLSLLDPITGTLRYPVSLRPLDPADFEFRLDMFRSIQRRLRQLNQRCFFSSILGLGENSEISKLSIDQFNASITHLEINEETIHKLLIALATINRRHPDHRELIEKWEAKLNQYNAEITHLEINEKTVHKLLTALKKINPSNPVSRELIEKLEAKLNQYIKKIPHFHKEQFYSLIPEIKAARVSHLELPWWAQDEDLEKISNIPLKSLRIGVDTSDESLVSLNLPIHQLHDLIIKSALITCKGLAFVSRIPLQKLVLRGVFVTEYGLEEVAKIQTLQELDLAWTGTTNEGMKRLSNLALIKLDLTGTEISDGCIPSLDRMASLHELKLTRTKCSSDRFDAWRISRPSLNIIL